MLRFEPGTLGVHGRLGLLCTALPCSRHSGCGEQVLSTPATSFEKPFGGAPRAERASIEIS